MLTNIFPFKKENMAGPPLLRKILFCVFAASVIFYMLRFYRVTTYPPESWSDEIVEARNSALISKHVRSLFYSEPFFDGARGTLQAQATSLLVPLIREHIEYYRFVPLITHLAFLAGLYLLARMLFGGFTACLAVFAGALSFWNFSNSRIFMCVFDPVISVFLIYFLLKALNGEKLFYIPAAVLYILGFNIYTSFYFVVPAVFYFFFDYYAGKKIGKREFWPAVASLAALTLLMLYATVYSTGVFDYTFDAYYRNNAGVSPDIISNLKNIYLMFVTGLPAHWLFQPYTPLLNPVELLLLILGAATAFLNIRGRENRMVLAMLFSFCLPLILLKSMHQMRILHAQTPVYILTALGLNRIFNFRRPFFYIILAAMAAASLLSITSYFMHYDPMARGDTLNKNFAYYLNTLPDVRARYLENFDLEQPEKTYLRLKSFYGDYASCPYVAVKLNGYWSDFIDDYMKTRAKDAGYRLALFGSDAERRQPFALLVARADSETGKKLISLDNILKTAKPDYERGMTNNSVEIIRKQYSNDIFTNTILKEREFLVFLFFKRPYDAITVVMSSRQEFWKTADLDSKISAAYSMLNRKKEADYYHGEYLTLKEKFMSSHTILK
jgi:hypothetical protein